MKVEGQGFGHPVFAVMGGKIVVPLPFLAAERLLGIDLDLLDVELRSQQLHGRPHQPRVAHQPREGVVAQV